MAAADQAIPVQVKLPKDEVRKIDRIQKAKPVGSGSARSRAAFVREAVREKLSRDANVEGGGGQAGGPNGDRETARPLTSGN